MVKPYAVIPCTGLYQLIGSLYLITFVHYRLLIIFHLLLKRFWEGRSLGEGCERFEERELREF